MFTEEGNKLKGVFEFKDFKQAFAFMTEVAMHAEQQNHHPFWSNVWSTVVIELNTHDAGNIVTEKDHKLANTIIEVFKRHTS